MGNCCSNKERTSEAEAMEQKLDALIELTRKDNKASPNAASIEKSAEEIFGEQVKYIESTNSTVRVIIPLPTSKSAKSWATTTSPLRCLPLSNAYCRKHKSSTQADSTTVSGN
eukprot:TRINITY_DN9317_c0_g7_i2.p1 TRINITY_DN9317_c0_g7~~TRINITY_DN9317_c0_g7_i2.p1  ORF type:complete len:113 (-),score=6.20 TRINITY_DN9317_c0_g7_i2:150-488(-)